MHQNGIYVLQTIICQKGVAWIGEKSPCYCTCMNGETKMLHVCLQIEYHKVVLSLSFLLVFIS